MKSDASGAQPLPVRDLLVALCLAFLLSGLAGRAGRLLTFDGYHYVEFAKQFSQTWPDRFGNHWPFGWPLAGGLLARLGLPGYEALLGLAALSLVGLATCAALVIRLHPARLGVLCAIGSAPIIAPQIGSCLTELPFAAALLGLAVCLAHWPRRAALWGAAACAVLALGIRYAGLVALAMIAVALFDRWSELRKAARLREAITALVVAGLVTAVLLGINLIRSGHASGAGRGGALGLASVHREIPSFGWSAPSALLAGGLRDRIGPDTILGLVIGTTCFALIAALCAWSWFRPRTAYTRPLAVVAFGYSSGMCVLHAVGDFDALYNARSFLPALAPLALLVAELLAARRVVLWSLCAVVVGAGLVGAARGISREIGGEVSPAATALRPLLAPGDRIAINDHAMTLSAYLPHSTDRMWAENWTVRPDRPFLVAAGKPTGRAGAGAVVSTDWTSLAERLVASGQYRYLVRTPALIALARVTPRPTAR